MTGFPGDSGRNDPFQNAAKPRESDADSMSASAGIRHAMRIWILPFTRLHRIPVAKRTWFYVFLMALYTGLVDWFTDKTFPGHNIREAGAGAYGGAIMGLLLVFRTNSAYERWWEGRKLWGQLVNDSRNLSLKVRTYIKAPQSEKTRFGQLVVSFSYALKHHLRKTKPSVDLPGLSIAEASLVQNMPVHVASKIFDNMQHWQQSEKLDNVQMLQFDPHLRAFMDICGACERIKNSPLAVSYRAFMRQGIALNLLALPWYITPEFSIWWSMPLILIGCYFLIGLELIAEDIEDPFGTDGDDLPLDEICSNIQKTVAEILPSENDQRYTGSFIAPRVDPLKQTGY